LGALWHPSSCVKVYSAQKKATQPSICVFLTANKPSTGCGLSYKLYKKIDNTSLSAFMEMYSNMTSVVRNRVRSSAPIPLLQKNSAMGEDVRSVLPSYINELINIISDSGLGICLYNYNISWPTVADDMILMAYSSYALQRMIYIYYHYSCKWRFEYNASKCAVIFFNRQCANQPKQSWSLGSDVITETSTYTHRAYCETHICHRGFWSMKRLRN